MDGRTDRWVSRRTDGMDGQMGWMNGWTNGRTDGWMDRTDGWMEWTGWTESNKIQYNTIN